MVHLFFEGTSPANSIALEAAPVYRLEGGRVCHADGRTVAHFHNHTWTVDGRFFTRCECKATTRIHFEHSADSVSEPFGPFDLVQLIGGVLRTDTALFATFREEQRLWHHIESGTDWNALVLSAA